MVRGAGSERGFGERPKPDDTAGEGPALLHQTPAPQPPLGHERPIYPHDLCGGLIPTLLCRGPVVARRWGPFLPPASLPLCARIKGTDERSSASKAQHVPCKSDTRLCLSPCPQWATTEHAPMAPPEKARAQHSETLTSCIVLLKRRVFMWLRSPRTPTWSVGVRVLPRRGQSQSAALLPCHRGAGGPAPH